jgi:hypothetical protein
MVARSSPVFPMVNSVIKVARPVSSASTVPSPLLVSVFYMNFHHLPFPLLLVIHFLALPVSNVMLLLCMCVDKWWWSKWYGVEYFCMCGIQSYCWSLESCVAHQWVSVVSCQKKI